jgi:type IX secretion system PorP/SprF family membrane protein
MLNPAQAGANPYSDVSVLGSLSMVGITGAPTTYSATGNFSVFKSLGLGATISRDQHGPVTTTRGSVNVAYHLKVSEQWKVALGLRVMFSSMFIDLPSLNTTVENDPHMANALNSGTLLGAGWGLLAYNRFIYIGIAQPHIGITSFSNVDMSDYITSNGFVGYVGGNIPLHKTFDFRPNLTIRYVNNQPLYADVNAMFTYKKKFDFGISYQYASNVGVVLGYEIKNKFYVGYSYSIPTSELNRVSLQTHEAVLRLKFNEAKPSKFQGPRFFN